MKKLTAIFLSVLMLFSVMGIVASAATIPVEEVAVTGQCTHEHKDDAPCHCCVWCPNIDISYLTSCAKNSSADGKYDGSLCCYECTGIFPCTCGCSCCAEDNQGEDITDGDNKIDDYWTDEDQDNFVSGFQSILKTISDWFDQVFDMIFEFLKFDEIIDRT
ncbi:MAG: hypothetical protein IJ491_01355 [Clostridia bacterium]|nr:hypothetical protein [Clostridia bacterium]